MEELINDRNRTVVIVSHSLTTLRKLCNRVMWLDSGTIKEIGDTETVLNAYVGYMN